MMALSPPAAFAGYYDRTYTLGTGSWQELNIGETEPYGGPLEWEHYEGTADFENFQEAEVTMSGPITAKFTWIPNQVYDPMTGEFVDDPNDTPPSRVVVKESAAAFWSAFGEVTGHGSANCGMPNPTEQREDDWGTSSGVKYTVKDNPGTYFEVSSSPGVTAGASLDYGAIYTGYLMAEVSYDAEIVQRYVTVTRPGAHDETVDKDGTVHGDTIYSYKDDLGSMVSLNKIYNTFVANAIGEWLWLPPTSYSWNPAHSGSRPANELELLMPTGSPMLVSDGWWDTKWVGSPTGVQTQTITCTVTDARNGMSATGTYELKIHDQVEELTDSKFRYLIDVGVVDHFYGPITAGTPAATKDFTYNSGGLTFQGSTPAIAKWFPVFSITYTPPSTNITTHASLGSDLPDGYYAEIMKREARISHLLAWRAYDVGGQVFADPLDHEKKHTDTAIELEGVAYSVSGPIPLNPPVEGP